MSLLITLLFFAIVLWFSYDGYRNGLYYGIARLVTLVIVYLLSWPLGTRFADFFKVEMVPLVFRPHVGTLLIGIVLFGAGSIVSKLIRVRTMKLPEEPSPDDLLAIRNIQLGGLALGGLAGVVLGILLFVILWNLGWLAEELHVRNEIGAKTPFINEIDSESPLGKSKIREPIVRNIIQVKRGIDEAFIAGLIHASNPVKTKEFEVVRGLLGVVKDRNLQFEFRRHPDTQELLQNPLIRDLFQDEEIQRLVRARDYRTLLNNKKLAQLITNKKISEQFRRANLRQVLLDIRRKGQQSNGL